MNTVITSTRAHLKRSPPHMKIVNQEDSSSDDNLTSPNIAGVARSKAPARVANTTHISPIRKKAKQADFHEEYEYEMSDEEYDDSIFEDALEEMGDDELVNEPDFCTPQEAQKYRLELRKFGPSEFCSRTVEAGKITAKKLVTAFNIRPPYFLEGMPDDAYYGLLSLALSRELSKRIKLPQYNSFEDCVRLLDKSKKIIVLTGAGVSTSLGIPDFRSKDIGLYSQLAHLGLNDPQEVFSLDLFNQDPSVFYSVAKEILPTDTERHTPTHAFIAMLQNKGKLLTNYTQNIDNIERAAGVLPEKIIQCHGSFATATCTKCRHQVEGSTIFDEIRAGVIPTCKVCPITRPTGTKRKRSPNGTSKQRKRSRRYSDDDDDDIDDDIPQPGIMKPDITFFGEKLPDHFADRLAIDKNEVDLVITIGTSLKVAPVSEVIPFLPAHVPQIYISREPVGHVNFDVDLLGDCDVVVSALCTAAGWNLDHEMIPKDQEVEYTTVEEVPSRHYFGVRKPELE